MKKPQAKPATKTTTTAKTGKPNGNDDEAFRKGLMAAVMRLSEGIVEAAMQARREALRTQSAASPKAKAPIARASASKTASKGKSGKGNEAPRALGTKTIVKSLRAAKAPVPAATLAASLGVTAAELAEPLRALCEEGKVVKERRGRGVVYALA